MVLEFSFILLRLYFSYMSGYVPAIKLYSFFVNFTLFEKTFFFCKILCFRNSDFDKCDILLALFFA